jgi:hypothetical protein
VIAPSHPREVVVGETASGAPLVVIVYGMFPPGALAAEAIS